MKIENPLALNYILQDEVYLLNNDRLLYAPERESVLPVEQPVKIDYSFMGKNQKAFLVLVHYPDHEFIPGEHLSALENILKRKALGLDDVAILNLHHHNEADIALLAVHFSPVRLLILGEKALPAGLVAPTYNQVGTSAHGAILYSFSFDEMMDNVEKKKLFWEQMKTF